MSLELKSEQKKAFYEVFKLVAQNEKIDKKGLSELFKIIDYKLTEEQHLEIVNRLFVKKDWISFEEFLRIFTIKLNDYTPVDVKNAFRLLAKDDDNFLSGKKIRKMLEKNGVDSSEVDFLMKQFEPFTDTNGRVNYNEFLKNLSM